MRHQRLKAAVRAALIHLLFGLLVIACLSIFVFGLWFPYPYYEISSGRHLFIILFLVDLVCGPLLTFLLFDPSKERWKWRVDISFILCLQLGALVYGLNSIASSRPIFLAYEGDRFRVVYSADIDAKQMHMALPEFSDLGWAGARLIGVKLLGPMDKGYLESLKQALNGEPPSFRPDRWVKYADQKDNLIKAIKSLENISLDPMSGYSFSELEDKTGLPLAGLGYLPLVQNSMTDWIVIIGREDGLPKAYWHVDGW